MNRPRQSTAPAAVAALLTTLFALPGCGGAGGGAGDFSQEFEKPAAAPAPAGDTAEAPEPLNPRDRRKMD